MPIISIEVLGIAGALSAGGVIAFMIFAVADVIDRRWPSE